MLNKFLPKPYGDVLIAFFVLCIAALLLVPLPTLLLDILIAFNIAFSLFLLLIGLSLPNALSLLTFPFLLLVTTAFRLSLNVASTRLILSQGDAGSVINSFGTFLIRGEIAVGVIIFLILTVINFIVIARGATRTSEVAARFVLDALPGKQMTIDSDLRAGLISAEQAKVLRDDLRKETQLYGSMDGSMKFVQGEVIAGIFIIFVNIFAGAYMGIKQGFSFEEVLQTYTMLTVGDGLVTQIPALLVSFCAGVVVTRVSEEKGSTISTDLFKQLLQNRTVVYFAAAVTLLLSFLPGVPALPFIFSALAFFLVAYFVKPPRQGGDFQAVERLVRPVLSSNQQSDTKLIEQDGNYVKLVLSPDLFDLYQNQKNKFDNWWQTKQDLFYQQYGLDLPAIYATRNANLTPGKYSLSHQEFQFASGEIPANSIALFVRKAQLAALGLKPEVVDHSEPVGELCWVKQTRSVNKLIQSCNLSYMDPFQFIADRVQSFYLRNSEELFSITKVHLALKNFENHYPGLFSGLFESGFVTSARLVEILIALYRSGFYFNDLKNILEILSLYVSTDGRELYEAGEFVLNDLVDFIRQNQKRKLLANYMTPEQSIRVLILSDEIQNAFLSSAGHSLATRKQLLQSLESVYDTLSRKSWMQVVVLAPNELRSKVSSFLQSQNCWVPVLGIQELDAQVKLEPVGIWTTLPV